MDFQIKMNPKPGDKHVSKAMVVVYDGNNTQHSGQMVLEGETAETRLMLPVGGRIEITELERPLVYDPEQFAAVPVDFTPEDTLSDPNRPKPTPSGQYGEPPVRGTQGIPGAKAGEPGYGATGRAPTSVPTAKQAWDQQQQSLDRKPPTPSSIDRTPAGHDMPISYDPVKAQEEKDRKEREERKREEEARARNEAGVVKPPLAAERDSETKGGKVQPHNTVDTKPASGGLPHSKK